MHDKIRQYVNYQFRFDERSDIEELKEEIIANLIDRYEEYRQKGLSEEEAYIEAIKSMGDFSQHEYNKISDEYSIKPQIPDILLMCGAILSIFGMILTLYNGVAGTIITAISILLFSGSAYYLYSYSQYIRKQYMDIDKHNLLLTKIFKYMKTSFIFWAISLSLIMTRLVISIITGLILLDPTIISVDDIGAFITIIVLLFIGTLSIFLYVFNKIYQRLMNHYYLLTGNKELRGKIKESYDFVFGQKDSQIEHIIVKNAKSYTIYPFIIIIMVLPQLFFSFYFVLRNDSLFGIREYHYKGIFLFQLFRMLKYMSWPLAILPLISLGTLIFLLFKAFTKKLKNLKLVIYWAYGWFISVVLISFIAGNITYFFENMAVSNNEAHYSLVMMLLLTLIIIGQKIYLKRRGS